MSVSVKRYETPAPMSNEEIARHLGVSLNDPDGNPYGFTGFWRGDEWVGGKSNDTQFTVTLRKGAENLHAKAAEFATFVGEA